MPLSVMLLVLFGALLHASWNAIVKAGDNKLREAGLVAGGAAVVAACGLPFVPLPAPASWPWLAAAVVVHQVYYAMVAAAYRAGDMGHTYPLMRGTAPLIVALISAPLLGETLTGAAWAGIGLICGSILMLAFHRHVDRKATLIALGNALVIATYTLVDGFGARLSGHAVSYVLWLTFLSGPPIVTWLLWHDGPGLRQLVRKRSGVALAGGACSIGSYGFALWAMTQAPLATVAALRETSVLFAVGISVFLLGEPGGIRRIIAAVLVVAGAATLRFS